MQCHVCGITISAMLWQFTCHVHQCCFVCWLVYSHIATPAGPIVGHQYRWDCPEGKAISRLNANVCGMNAVLLGFQVDHDDTLNFRAEVCVSLLVRCFVCPGAHDEQFVWMFQEYFATVAMFSSPSLLLYRILLNEVEHTSSRIRDPIHENKPVQDREPQTDAAAALAGSRKQGSVSICRTPHVSRLHGDESGAAESFFTQTGLFLEVVGRKYLDSV